MLPSYYEYYNPVKIVAGNKALYNLPSELNELGSNRPMVITDKGIVKAGLIKLVKKSFAGSKMTIGAMFDGVPPDSSKKIVNKISKIYRKNKCDSIVAVGGGSVIDTAKGVNILITEDSDDLLKFAGAEMLKKPMKPLIIVPTTAGTGSEVTIAAIISDLEKNIKMSFVSCHLLPKVAILDPEMTLSLPPAITAATGMDALSHAVEGYIGLQKNPISDAYSFAAIELIRKNLIRAVQDSNNPFVRFAMANAAVMAGASFSNSMVGMAHSLGHATGGVCHVPHGIAVNIFLPFALEYNLSKCEEDIAKLLLPMAGAEEYARTRPTERAMKTIAHIRELQKALNDLCGLPVTLKQADVPRNELEIIAEVAVNDPSIIMNPREMDKNDALEILYHAFE